MPRGENSRVPKDFGVGKEESSSFCLGHVVSGGRHRDGFPASLGTRDDQEMDTMSTGHPSYFPVPVLAGDMDWSSSTPSRPSPPPRTSLDVDDGSRVAFFFRHDPSGFRGHFPVDGSSSRDDLHPIPVVTPRTELASTRLSSRHQKGSYIYSDVQCILDLRSGTPSRPFFSPF